MGEKENIIRGPELRLQDISFGKVMYDGLKKGRNEIAMVDGITREETTYKELLQRSISLAQHMKQWGLKKNDAITISSDNSLYFVLPALSAMYLGMTVAPLNHIYTEREFFHGLNISKPKVIFCAYNILDKIIKVCKQLKYVSKIVVINKCDGHLPKSIIKMEDLFYLPPEKDFKVTEVKMDDVIAILCSSGTTGLPKGVMLTHQAYNATLYYLQHNGYGNYSRDKIALCLLPFFHAYGFCCMVGMLASNMKMIVLSKFEEHLFLRTIQDYRITQASLVPPLVLFLSKNPLVDKYDVSSLKEILCGAAPLSKEVQDAVIKRLNVNVRQGYGLTELTLASTMQPFLISRSGSVGVLVPGIECKVIDPETGKSLGFLQAGELCFRGPCIMKGYANDPKNTAATIDKDGWLHSGDVGYYDRDHFFYVIDRYKELIKYKAFQVPPAEIEGILLSHPEISDCAVIGKPDEIAGELPLAFVVKKPNATITEKDVMDFVAKNVSSPKKLRGGVRFVDSIPKSPTGKILRRVLRDQLKKLQSKM